MNVLTGRRLDSLCARGSDGRSREETAREVGLLEYGRGATTRIALYTRKLKNIKQQVT